MCAHSKPHAVLDYEARIDLASRSWNIIPVIRKFYPLKGEGLFEGLEEHDVVKRCLEFMLQKEFPKRLGMTITDREGKPVANPDYRPYLFSDVLVRLAYEYVDEFDCSFSEQNFKRIFDEMMAYIYAEKQEVVAVAPLENFELVDAEEASIDMYKIRKLSEWEMKQLIRMGRADSLGTTFFPSFGFIENAWCIEVAVQAPKRITPDLRSNISEFIAIMRLLKSGIVMSNVVLEYSKIGNKFSGISASWGLARVSAIGLKYILRQDEVDSLSQLWNLYKRLRDELPRELRTALRWFNKSYEDLDVEDRVLDLAIAFESIFGGRIYEYLTPRLVASDFNERKEIREYLKELRDARNSIVHGGHGRSSKVKPEATTANAEEVFRRCYKRFLELMAEGKSYDEIIDEALYG